MVTERSRVLRLITRLNIGGPARQALLLTKALQNEFPTVLAAGDPEPGEGELGDPDVAVTKVALARPLHPARDLKSVLSTRRLLRETGASLLHTHMAKAGTVGRVAARSMPRRPRTVHTFHGHVLDGYFSPAVEKTFVMIERTLALTSDVLVAVSSEIRDQLLDLGIGRASQFRVIPLGFDLSAFLENETPSGRLRSDMGLPQDVPLVGVLGRLAPIKDHAVLLEAIAGLDGVHLAVLGDGELLGDLRRKAAALDVASKVHFVGWRHDVADAISDMDVVALTSRNEGSPVSLIEALACARPVVATDVGGVKSVVRHGETGYLVPAGAVESIRDRLASLISDEALRRRMGAAGRTDVARRYSSDRLVADIRSLYGELLS